MGGRRLDALWAHASTHDGLEHIRARAGPGRIDLVLFFRESPGDIAAECASALLERTYQGSPAVSATYTQPPSFAREGERE